jgi:hypothetical protein
MKKILLFVTYIERMTEFLTWSSVTFRRGWGRKTGKRCWGDPQGLLYCGRHHQGRVTSSPLTALFFRILFPQQGESCQAQERLNSPHVTKH